MITVVLHYTTASPLGWDMGAALAMAQALGIDTMIAAELLPVIEAVMVRKLNEDIAAESGADITP